MGAGLIAAGIAVQTILNAIGGNAQGEATIEGAKARAEMLRMSQESTKKYTEIAKSIFWPYKNYGDQQVARLGKMAKGTAKSDAYTKGILKLAQGDFSSNDPGQQSRLEEEILVGQEDAEFNRTMQGARLGLGVTKGLGAIEQASGEALSKAMMSTGRGYVSALQSAAKSRQDTIGTGVSLVGEGLAEWEYAKERKRKRLQGTSEGLADV